MTHFLRDILRQPKELRRTIDFLFAEGRPPLDAATAAIRSARHVYLTGIGSSWHAALSAGTLFSLGASPVYMQDAAELLEYATFPPDRDSDRDFAKRPQHRDCEIAGQAAREQSDCDRNYQFCGRAAGKRSTNSAGDSRRTGSRDFREYLFDVGVGRRHSR